MSLLALLAVVREVMALVVMVQRREEVFFIFLLVHCWCHIVEEGDGEEGRGNKGEEEKWKDRI